MMRRTPVTLLLTVAVTVAMVTAAEHKKVHFKKHGGEERYDKEGKDNVVFDHLSILGSRRKVEEFDELEEEESEHRLGLLAIKMDRDGNGQVDKEELKHWIVQSYDLLDKEDALDDFKTVDGNENGRVTWYEYLTHLHTTEKDINTLQAKKNRTEMEETLLKLDIDLIDESMKVNRYEMAQVFCYTSVARTEVLRDEKKFKAADTNQDEALTLEEYYSFFHPASYKHMQQFVLEEALANHDDDKDGKFSFKEFVAFEDDTHEEDKGKGDKERKLTELKEEKETFDEYDLDKNGILDKGEILGILMTDHSIDAKAEAEHLIEVADDNSNGQLDYEEIVEHHETFGSHPVTGEGEYLYYVKHRDEL